MRRLNGGWRVWGVLVVVIAVALATLVDEPVHDLVFRYVASHEARLLANGVTLLGTTEASAGLLGVLAIVGFRTADAVLLRGSVGGLAGLGIGGAASQGVKHIACRARPRLLQGWGVGSTDPPSGDPSRRGFFHWPCFARWRYHSFPSGHATTAFTVASALTALAPTRRRVWLTVAVGVGASRVLLNAHFVSDVLGGALLGWWAGEAGQWVVARFATRLGGAPPASDDVAPVSGDRDLEERVETPPSA